MLAFRAPRGVPSQSLWYCAQGSEMAFARRGKSASLSSNCSYLPFPPSSRALFEIETGEIALVDSRASVEPTEGNRSAEGHHRLACSSSGWSSVLVIRGQSLGS